MKRLRSVSPLLTALHSGIDAYQPDLPAVPDLETETGDLAASNRNIRRLFAEGFTLCNLIKGKAGILFCFDTGEEYLALGFDVGRTPKAFVLAKVIADAGYGEAEDLAGFYTTLPDDFEGPMPLDLFKNAA